MFLKSKLNIVFFLGCLFSAAGIYFAFKNIPFNDLISAFGTINYWWTVPSVTAVFLSYLIRSVRWHLILSSNCEKPPAFRDVHNSLIVGFSFNYIFPGRAGELIRPGLLSRMAELPYFKVLSTVIAERIFDLIIMLILMSVVFNFTAVQPGKQILFNDYLINQDLLTAVFNGMVKLTGLLLIVIIFIIWDKSRRIIVGVLNLIKKSEINMLHIFAKTAVKIITDISNGISFVKSPILSFQIFLLSLCIWGIQAGANYIMAMGCPGIHLSYWDHIMVMTIIAGFISIPSVPGFWGLWEAGSLFAFSFFSAQPESVAGYTIVNHAVQIIPVTLFGIVLLMFISRQINIKGLIKRMPNDR